MQGNARGTYGSGCNRTLLHAIVYHCIYYCTSLQILLTLLARRACAEIDRVVTREANKKWRFSVVLIHCVISFKIAEFRQ